MSVPEHKTVAYECENGHVNDSHDLNHSAEPGKKCVCADCGALLTKKLVPLYHCKDCGNTWAYAGDADRPTCSNCRGKRVAPVGE